jgi:sugar O-acyltransferase (sialic acid O-acetyltransferase NeuD family)
MNSKKHRFKISGFVVENAESTRFLNLPVYSMNDFLHCYSESKRKPKILVAVGDVKVNQRISQIFYNSGFDFFSVIGKGISLDSFDKIGSGVMIYSGSMFTNNISLGSHSIINIGATISHDVIIGSYVNICPGVNVAGGVIIEDGVFIGTGAVILPKIILGKNCIVGAGAVVIKNVRENEVVVGNPAKVIKRN